MEKFIAMADENPTGQEYTKEDEQNFQQNGMRQYGVYSAIVFQMLATMGIGFWGGKKLNDYFAIENNLLTIGIGILAMVLAFYNLLKQLKNAQNEK